jgi:MYXO-CTERM domain-containing protein
MRVTTGISLVSSVAVLSVGLAASSAAADTTSILDFTYARMTGNYFTPVDVAGRDNVAVLSAIGAPNYGTLWGAAAGGAEGFGMQASGFQGVGGWAGGLGASLADITGVSFDWYRFDGLGSGTGLGGGFRLAMYVYSPGPDDTSGFLQFDLSALLPNQTNDSWNSTGNYLLGPTGSAWYSADYGASAYSGYKTWAEIQTALAGWSVYEVGIINDAGMVVAIDDFAVTFVPAPGAIALLGLAGLAPRRRR